jgi:hypothetical protein
VETKERLQAAKQRVTALQSSKDQINREQGVEQQKLNEAYAKLKELGVDSPENLSAKELQALADSTKVQLDEKLTALEGQLTQGETLIAKYQQLQA